MPLIALWDSSPEVVDQFTIEQIVAFSGDGNLRDGSVCSCELHEYLSKVPSEKLFGYVEQCLTARLERGGMVLQDLVNELGRRLDYKVTNGRYRGAHNVIGHDGVWVSPEGNSLIVEVKTTDAYRISLDTIIRYRTKLQEAGLILNDSYVLIVVGREDTGELEAQIRGSRHAWDVRLISAEALIKLVKLKENSDELETGRKIRSVLMPVEYTRLDGLVDVMFTTATDVETSDVPVVPTVGVELDERRRDSTSAGFVFTDSAILQKKREEILSAMGRRLGAHLIRRTRALYWDSEHKKRVACTLSKRYSEGPSYWYAYHPKWDEFLGEGEEGFLCSVAWIKNSHLLFL